MKFDLIYIFINLEEKNALKVQTWHLFTTSFTVSSSSERNSIVAEACIIEISMFVFAS